MQAVKGFLKAPVKAWCEVHTLFVIYKTNLRFMSYLNIYTSLMFEIMCPGLSILANVCLTIPVGVAFVSAHFHK